MMDGTGTKMAQRQSQLRTLRSESESVSVFLAARHRDRYLPSGKWERVDLESWGGGNVAEVSIARHWAGGFGCGFAAGGRTMKMEMCG